MTQTMSIPRPAVSADGGGLGAARMVIVLAIMSLTNMLNAMDRQIFPILLPQIQTHFQFPIEAAGLLSTIFTLGIGLAALPAGLVADRFNRKLVIVVSVGLFSLATGLQAFAVQFADMFAYRVLTGIGEGIQNAVLFAVAGAFFSRRRTMALGMLTAAYGLGAALSPVLGATIMGVTGRWQTPLITLGLFGVTIMLLWGLVPRSVTEVTTPSGGPSAAAQRAQAPAPDRAPGTTRNIVVLCIVAAVSGAMIYGYLGLYPTYLIKVRQFTTSQAALVMSTFGIGGLMAIPLGALADRWNQKLLNLLALVGFAVVGISIFTVSSNAMAIQVVLSFLMGMLFTGIVYPNSMSLLQKNMPPARGGYATGLFVAMLYIPSSVSGYVLGYLVTHFGWQTGATSMIAALSGIALITMIAYRPNAQPFN